MVTGFTSATSPARLWWTSSSASTTSDDFYWGGDYSTATTSSTIIFRTATITTVDPGTWTDSSGTIVWSEPITSNDVWDAPLAPSFVPQAPAIVRRDRPGIQHRNQVQLQRSAKDRAHGLLLDNLTPRQRF